MSQVYYCLINQRIPIRINDLRLGVQVSAWKSPSGKHIVLRRLQVSQQFAIHKSQELFADAWLLRAFRDKPPDNFVLLLSVPKASNVATISYKRRARLIDAKVIDIFQSSGWNVFPWDFAEREPTFITYLRKYGGTIYG